MSIGILCSATICTLFHRDYSCSPLTNKEVIMAIPYAKPLQLPISSATTDGQVSSQMQPTISPPQAALHAAARDNHPQTAKDLIEKGAKIDKKTIIRALVGESQDVLDVLIEHGWDINVSLGHIGDALM